MSNLKSAIATLHETLRRQEQEARDTKRVINKLSAMERVPIPFPDVEEDANDIAANIGRDTFYGVPLATAIKKYLDFRRKAGRGPATVNEIYAALTAGGYKFDTKNESNAKRGLYISLAKNSVTFHKLPGTGESDEASVFGLLEWYPAAKNEPEPKKKVRRRKAAGPAPAALVPALPPAKIPKKGTAQ